MKRRLRVERIRKRLTDIGEAAEIVAEHLPKSSREFAELGLVKDGIYKKIEFALESVLDILAILNADLALGVPEKEEDFIAHAERRRIITSELAEKLRAMRGFRNILIDRYGGIDDQLAFRTLTDHLNDFNDFVQAIERFLARPQNSPQKKSPSKGK
jgi:uncharacterized protein YutE (UPF0331/DUF86 family)